MTTPPDDLHLYSTCELPTGFGTFAVHVYRDASATEHVLLTLGDPAAQPAPFVRVHSECFTGEVLGSLKCDCRHQLHTAMARIAELGHGAVVYLRQEGRGIGLGDKIRAYAEQEKGADTIEANERLGLPVDAREFGVAAEILARHGIHAACFHTNNPRKIQALKAHGITIREVVTSPAPANPHNEDYLRTKQERLGHQGLWSAPPIDPPPPR